MMNRIVRRRTGFTLIEVLIVVVILGILASTVLPQFANSSGDAKEAALRENLAQLRRQFQLYRFEHDGNCPSGTAANVSSQMTMATDINGNTANPGTQGYSYGPYLNTQFPTNPYNGGNGILVKTTNISATDVDPTAMQGTVPVGWIFSSSSGQIIPNSNGTTSAGVPLSSL
jgi:prepilin-type N-terminal cleavage/methylation domain-containing protein